MTAGTRRIGWVVDVQHDFMRPEGRLYVHDLFDAGDAGAVQATASIVRTVDWMREHCDVVVYTGDWHAYGDREIDTVAPDATRGTYPPHCMGLSPDPAEQLGAALIEEIAPGERALILPRDATPSFASVIAHSAVAERRPVFIQKREFSVFEGNDGADAFVGALRQALRAPDGRSDGDIERSDLADDPEFIVCGVATDVCVKQAVDGLLDRQATVTIVRDATWSLGLLPAAETWERWEQRGARLAAVDELVQLPG